MVITILSAVARTATGTIHVGTITSLGHAMDTTGRLSFLPMYVTTRTTTRIICTTATFQSTWKNFQHLSNLSITTPSTNNNNNDVPRKSIHRNKYDRFRNNNALLFSHPQRSNLDSLSDSSIPIPFAIPRTSSSRIFTGVAKDAMSALAQKPNRTWKRLSHLVELAFLHSVPTGDQSRPLTYMADIGCDHGLLSIALASSGQYQQVIGVDVSPPALKNGALHFMKKVHDILHFSSHSSVPSLSSLQKRDHDPRMQQEEENSFPSWERRLEFRVGDGLYPLRPGEAHAICMAGLGVETMIQILSQPRLDSLTPTSHTQNVTMNTNTNKSNIHSNPYYIHHIGTEHLFLQPTHSRPRYLVKLYQAVSLLGWNLLDERIEYIHSRWYITSAFRKRNVSSSTILDPHWVQQRSNSTLQQSFLPGHFLQTNPQQKEEYERYVHHHLEWMEQDFQRKGKRCPEDELWYHTYKNDT